MSSHLFTRRVLEIDDKTFLSAYATVATALNHLSSTTCLQFLNQMSSPSSRVYMGRVPLSSVRISELYFLSNKYFNKNLALRKSLNIQKGALEQIIQGYYGTPKKFNKLGQVRQAWHNHPSKKFLLHNWPRSTRYMMERIIAFSLYPITNSRDNLQNSFSFDK